MTNKIMLALSLCVLCFIHALNAQTVAGKINSKTNNATIVFNGTASQTVPNPTAFNNQEVYNLTIDNAAGVVGAGTTYLNIFGTLFLLNGTYTTSGSLYIIGNITAASGKIQPGNNIIGMFGTTGVQSLPLNTFTNNRIGVLTINNASGVNLTTWGGVNTTLNLQSGTLATGGTFIIGGGISYTSGGINAGNDTIKFSGTTTQAIPAGTFIGNNVARLSIFNGNGITSSSALNVANSLNVFGIKTTLAPLTAAGKTVDVTGSKLVVSSFDAPPVGGQVYTIITCGTLTGTFSSTTLPAGVTGTLSYTSNSAVLTITSAMRASILSFNGSSVKGQNQLDWSIANDTGLTAIDIERSADTCCFVTIGTPLIGTNSFEDKTPLKGNNFYRLKLVSKNGDISYSSRLVLPFKTNPSLLVYPNPVVNEAVVLHEEATAGGVILLYDLKGNKVFATKVAIGCVQSKIAMKNLPPGSYILSYYNGKLLQSKTLIKQ